MKVASFMETDSGLKVVEVELSLTQGLPYFQFIGLPDTAMKESVLRIRSALRNQGFDLPPAQQILVNLRPTHLRKSSKGLDLAVAAALLWETGQLELPQERPTLYGELSLKGEVLCPDDILAVPGDEWTVYTGLTDEALHFPTLQMRELKEIARPKTVERSLAFKSYVRPKPAARQFPEPSARLAEIVAAGEHSCLIAGPPGSGKSTWTDSIAAWIDEPSSWPVPSDWRPVMKPHHSITPAAMIGGGTNLWDGEISRAHGGILILDELLEFAAVIQESLREPSESGRVRIVRGARARTSPAQALILATTNLCRCGKFVPRKNARACRCGKSIRARTMSRLKGPFVDRFSIVEFTDGWLPQTKKEVLPQVSSDEILSKVSKAIEYRKVARNQVDPNSRLPGGEIESTLSTFQRSELLPPDSGVSQRRKTALVQVARTLADLESRERISDGDLDVASRLCYQGHRLLDEWQE